MNMKALRDALKTNSKMIKECFLLMQKSKRWWLMPIFFIFTFLSLFLAIAGGSSVLPAIYALF